MAGNSILARFMEVDPPASPLAWYQVRTYTPVSRVRKTNSVVLDKYTWMNSPELSKGFCYFIVLSRWNSSCFRSLPNQDRVYAEKEYGLWSHFSGIFSYIWGEKNSLTTSRSLCRPTFDASHDRIGSYHLQDQIAASGQQSSHSTMAGMAPPPSKIFCIGSKV